MNSASDFYTDDWLILPNDTRHDNFDDNSSTRKTCAQDLPMSDLLPLLREPETHAPLHATVNGLCFANGRMVPKLGQRIALLPSFLADRLTNDGFMFEPDDIKAPGYHYGLISDMKAKGDNTNLDPNDFWYLRHCNRARYAFDAIDGIVLDIGCGNPSISKQVMPATARYIGLEPGPTASSNFSICGIAETLPFKDACLDAVVFNTSLDHILDEHTATEEAWRVLKPGGSIYVSILIWHQRASLLYDDAHFHHFRQWEIQSLLSRFQVERFMKVDWKGSDNRYEVYIGARKP